MDKFLWLSKSKISNLFLSKSIYFLIKINLILYFLKAIKICPWIIIQWKCNVLFFRGNSLCHRDRLVAFLIKNKITEFRKLYKNDLQFEFDMLHGKSFTVTHLIDLLSDLSKMTNAILTEYKYKILCFSNTTETEISYDKVIKYNYSPEDLNSLIELIGYIKSLSSLLINCAPKIIDYVYKRSPKAFSNSYKTTSNRQLFKGEMPKTKLLWNTWL
jgi:hypothetical protein